MAPRRLSLETCLRPRFSRDHVDVKLQGPFVRAELAESFPEVAALMDEAAYAAFVDTL